MRWLRRVLDLAAPLLLLAASGAAAQRARADPPATGEPLLLEVIVNGIDSEKIAAFDQRGDRLFTRASELRDVGIAVPDAVADDTTVDLATLKNLRFVVDTASQTITIKASIAGLARHRIDYHRENRVAVRASPTGLLVNYDITATSDRGRLDTFGLFSARLFGRRGTLQSDATITRSRTGTQVVRLATTYSYAEPDKLRTWSLGDVISGSLADTRSVRLGGIQLATDFALRPDLITYPLPVVSGGTAVPSTVDVLVNGVRQLNTAVAAGPFYVPQLPVVSGAGQISVSVRDAAGHQTVQTSSFYASSALLAPGLNAFSLEAGAIRRNFGVDSNNYGPVAVSATGRRGLTDTVTVEGHAEAAGRLGLLRGGAVFDLGRFAIVSGGVAASRSHVGTGLQTYAAIDRTTQLYHVGVSMQIATRRYRDIGSLAGDPSPSHVIQAGAGVNFGRNGSLGLAYTDISQLGVAGASQASAPVDLYGPTTVYLRPAIRTSLLSATYSREAFKRAYVYVTGYQDMRTRRGAIMAGISLRFGGRGSLSSSYESSTHQATIEASRPAIEPGQLGYRAYAATGADDHELAELRYHGTHGDVGIGVDHYGGDVYVQANARGSVIAMSGGVFAANVVNDGFAVVDTNGIGNVDVTLNNHPVGHTDRSGRLLVPGLLSYQANVVAIDPNKLPIDAQWSRLEDVVATGVRSGAIAEFGLARRHPLLIVLRRVDGSLLPIASRIILTGDPTERESGFDGQVYFEDLVGTHRLTAVMPDGSRCTATISNKATASGLPPSFQCLPMPAQMANAATP